MTHLELIICMHGQVHVWSFVLQVLLQTLLRAKLRWKVPDSTLQLD